MSKHVTYFQLHPLTSGRSLVVQSLQIGLQFPGAKIWECLAIRVETCPSYWGFHDGCELIDLQLNNNQLS